MIKEKDIEELGQFIINELGKELIKQNHRATGKLISSLDFRVTRSPQSTDLLIEMNDYGEWVNTGRRAGAKKVPIAALVQWIKDKGIASNNKRVVGIAFAIQKKIEKEGIPTRNSRAKGKRIGFIDDTIDRITAEINRRVLDLNFKTIEVEIDKLIASSRR